MNEDFRFCKVFSFWVHFLTALFQYLYIIYISEVFLLTLEKWRTAWRLHDWLLRAFTSILLKVSYGPQHMFSYYLGQKHCRNARMQTLITDWWLSKLSNQDKCKIRQKAIYRQQRSLKNMSDSDTKGQLISEANFEVFIWTKKRTKIFLYFCPSL